jgi:hypothetical protein
MGASNRRWIFRLQLGVNRKLTVSRWIGCATVGVVNTTSTRLKAREGAERSCRSRRRKRGQRKGKRRSRGCHPRRSVSLPAQTSKEPGVRSIGRHLRACDHWYERVAQFEKLFRASKMYEELKVQKLPKANLMTWRVWSARWKVLHDRIKPYGEGVTWCSRIGPTFSYFLEQRFGIIATPTGPSASSAAIVLRDMLQWVTLDTTSILGNRPRDNRRYEAFCDWCHIVVVLNTRSGFCPKCRRALLSSVRHGRRRQHGRR